MSKPIRAEVDFQALIPRDFEASIGINIARGVSLSTIGEGSFFTAEIVRRRFNPHGRELKSLRVITICGKSGEELPELLRTLATLFETRAPVRLERGEGS